MRQPTRFDRRAITFVLFSVLVVAAGAGYLTWTRARSVPEPSIDTANADIADRLPDTPYLLFRNTDLGGAHGRAFITDGNPGGANRQITPLSCERVHVAADRGVCLTAEPGTTPLTTSYHARVFDRTLQVRHTLPLPGLPSRVRLSPTGRFAGVTVFVSGDSYAAGSFSTRAILIDTTTGDSLGDLEQFDITRNGASFKAIDFNFWGFTFVDDRRFYATLQTGGRRYLVEGDVTTRSGRVVADDVECPALSPDGTRIAFKTREMSGGRLVFRLTVMDLRTMTRTFLAETRSVDDQPEWLDDDRVLYAIPSAARPGSTDVWSVMADGAGQPALYIAGAWSPAAVGIGSR